MSNPDIMWAKAFAWNATNRNTIQDERQASQDLQDATLNDGFPLVTMTAQNAGGIAPNGQDMNGALYAISSDMVHRQKGLRIQFDSAYAAKIGGYDKGCILASNDYTCDYISLVSNNTTDPNGSGTAGKWAIYSGAGSVSSATASIAGIVKIVDSLSSTATDAALTANQGKVLSDRTQQATTTNVGITRFATATEVTNKSSSNVAINPKNVVDMFVSQSNTEILPSGRILKWGKTTLIPDEGELRVNFPNGAFPNACFNVQLTENVKTTWANNASHVVAINQDRFGFTIYFNSTLSVSTSVDWFAIGY